MRERKDIMGDLQYVGDATPRNQLALYLARLFLEVLIDIRDFASWTRRNKKEGEKK